MSITLRQVAEYSKERVDLSEVTLDSYVTTDNLLQNKLGKVRAEGLPPQGGSTTKYQKGDILIANIRPYLRKIWFAENYGGSSADVLTLRINNDYDSKFVYYALFRDDFFNHMVKGSKGTKMPRGDKNQILDFTIPEFDPSYQKKVADFLSNLDSKISLNNRINQELEAMAKLIYDYWFVQFEFPSEALAKDGVPQPYKSSGGKMVYNEELKREIPEGWEVKELSEVANIIMGQSPPGSSYNNIGDGTLFFQGSTDFGWRYPETRQYTTEPSRMAMAGDILLSVRAPVGTFNVALEDCCIGRGLAALNSKDGYDSFLFYVMLYFKQIFDRRNAVGTTFGAITKDDLYSLQVLYPNKSLLEKFNAKVYLFNQMVRNNHIQNQKLSELRDWLLPMLMNGQVRVGDISKNDSAKPEPVKYKLPETEMNIAAEERGKYGKSRKPFIPPKRKAFAKHVLAGHIIGQCKETKEFTPVKLQKLVHLSEYMMEAELEHNYYYQTAGPYDNKLMNTLYASMKEKKWFESTWQGWKPLDNQTKIAGFFNNYFGLENPAFIRIMDKLGNASETQCELISTLYAVWNDRLIKKEEIDEHLLIKDFYSWSERKQSFSEEQVKSAIEWMKDKGFEPRGFGALIKRRKTR